MVAIPRPQNNTLLAIGQAIEASQDDYESVGIAGGDIGLECPRALWYNFRRTSAPEVITWKKRRIFESGNIEEDRLLDLLRLIGCEVTDQQARVRDCGNHLRGKVDGQVTGLRESKKEHLVECKSSNSKGFKAVLKAAPPFGEGIKISKPLHHATIQFYLHARGLERCLYMMSCKDTEDLYLERVKYDAAFALKLIARVNHIIASDDPPAKLHEDPSAKMAFVCRSMCKHLAVCHEGTWPRVHCRTCLHSTPLKESDAGWDCSKWNKPLSLAEQEAGCASHLYIPSLVPGEQTDADEAAETVTYKLRDGRTWIDGADVKTEEVV